MSRNRKEKDGTEESQPIRAGLEVLTRQVSYSRSLLGCLILVTWSVHKDYHDMPKISSERRKRDKQK